MQRLADRAVVAVFGVGDDRGQRQAGRARAAHQRQREPPLLLKDDRRRNPRRRAPRRIARPRLGQIQQGAHRPRALAASTAPPSPRLGNSPPCPSAPQYCRAAPTECGPDFGKLVSSRIRMPGALRASRPAAGATRTSASHGACVMKCWNAWYDVGSLTRASIADIDLRALSPSSPSTYWRNDTCCARWPKQSLN